MTAGDPQPWLRLHFSSGLWTPLLAFERVFVFEDLGQGGTFCDLQSQYWSQETVLGLAFLQGLATGFILYLHCLFTSTLHKGRL